MEAGEVAATGGTSGVVYGVTDKRQPGRSRVNTFVHVNHTASNPRYGILLCINGTGIMNSWIRRNVTQETLDYAEMNRRPQACRQAPKECWSYLSATGRTDALQPLSRSRSSGWTSTATPAHILRAAQEGIAYSFRYGIDIMRGLGGAPRRHPRRRSKLVPRGFRQTLSTLTGARIELNCSIPTAWARPRRAGRRLLQEARGEAFAALRRLEVAEPAEADRETLEEGYRAWVREVEKRME